MQELQREHFVDLEGVVPVALEVSPHHAFESTAVEVRPGKGPRVEQHFTDVGGESIPVPNPEMAELVPAQDETIQMKWREEVVDPGQPLRHPVVVGVFCFESELEEAPGGHCGEVPRVSIQAAVGPDSPK